MCTVCTVTPCAVAVWVGEAAWCGVRLPGHNALCPAGPLSAGTKANKFIVTYSIVPDPFHKFSFYTMPRTIAEAEKDKFALVSTNDADKTTLWCRDNDYRVCVYFDVQGSVAGIQLSVSSTPEFK